MILVKNTKSGSIGYYSLGAPMPGRNYHNSPAYRYGFNGHEKDDEITDVTGASYDTYYRGYDSRLGRWLSVDPIVQSYESPYAGIANNPIAFDDPYGDRIRYGSIKNWLNIRYLRKHDKDFAAKWKEIKSKYGGLKKPDLIVSTGKAASTLKDADVTDGRPDGRGDPYKEKRDYFRYNGSLDNHDFDVKYVEKTGEVGGQVKALATEIFKKSFSTSMPKNLFGNMWSYVLDDSYNMTGMPVQSASFSSHTSTTNFTLIIRNINKPTEFVDGTNGNDHLKAPSDRWVTATVRAMSIPLILNVNLTRHGWDYRNGVRKNGTPGLHTKELDFSKNYNGQ